VDQSNALRRRDSPNLSRPKGCYNVTVEVARSAGVLETSELGMPSYIELLIEDQLSDQSIPLPRRQPVEFRLQ